MAKKIWMFNHYATDMLENLGGRHFWFAQNLLKQGYEPAVFCSSFSHFTGKNLSEGKYSVDDSAGFAYVFINTSEYTGNDSSRIKNMIGFMQKLFSVTKDFAHKDGKPDIILASSPHLLTLLAGIFIARRYKIPCICEIRDLWPESIVAYGMKSSKSILVKMLYKLERYIYNKADALIFTLEGAREYIIDKKWDVASGGKIDLEKVYYINNGMIIRDFENNKQNFILEDADLNNPDIFKIVYTGSIRTVNNLGMLLDVAKNLKEKRIKFLIWGSGNEEDKLRQRVIDEGIDNVIFKGKVHKKYIPSIVSRANINIFILGDTNLYRYGLSLNKSFEYMAAEKPYMILGNAEYALVDKYECGIHVRSLDIETLSEKIDNLINMDNEDYQKMCTNAKEAAKEFDFGKHTDKLIEIIKSLKC